MKEILLVELYNNVKILFLGYFSFVVVVILYFKGSVYVNKNYMF